jgi:hypothetical protein
MHPLDLRAQIIDFFLHTSLDHAIGDHAGLMIGMLIASLNPCLDVAHGSASQMAQAHMIKYAVRVRVMM